MLKSDEFQCSMCQGTFKKGWSDEEARQERTSIFGEHRDEDSSIVCDDCFQKVKPISYKEFRAAVRKDVADVYRKIENHAMRRLLWKRTKETDRQIENLILYGNKNGPN